MNVLGFSKFGIQCGFINIMYSRFSPLKRVDQLINKAEGVAKKEVLFEYAKRYTEAPPLATLLKRSSWKHNCVLCSHAD
jgi:hypothetical protein